LASRSSAFLLGGARGCGTSGTAATFVDVDIDDTSGWTPRTDADSLSDLCVMDGIGVGGNDLVGSEDVARPVLATVARRSASSVPTTAG
jgi:hypothetical protein